MMSRSNAITLPAVLRLRAARVAVVALALGAPASALAAEPLAPGQRAEVVVSDSPSAEADPGRQRSSSIADPLLARVAAERRSEPAGPFHPVVGGSADYGDAQAAFGNARGRPHEGQDVFAPAGTTVIAPVDGVVVDAGSDGGRGNWIAIFDPAGERTYSYFHLLKPAAAETGEKVRAGRKVGEVGCTGSCSGDHLHFEVRKGRGPYGTAVDPMPFLERAEPRG